MLRVQRGDHAALGMLFVRYSRLVTKIGFRFLGHFADAQELRQDVFLQIFLKCHLFDPKKGNFRSWLAQVSKHRALATLRQNLTYRQMYDGRDLDQLVDVVPSAHSGDDWVEATELDERLRNGFSKLTTRQRTTLELYFFEGCTLREISERLDESMGNTRHHYYRGLKRLRASFKAQNADEA